MLQQLVPRNLATLQPSHAAKHAAQRCLYALCRLVVELARDDALNKALVLLAIRKGQVIAEGAIRRRAMWISRRR